jgi:hypothetical protein
MTRPAVNTGVIPVFATVSVLWILVVLLRSSTGRDIITVTFLIGMCGLLVACFALAGVWVAARDARRRNVSFRRAFMGARCVPLVCVAVLAAELQFDLAFNGRFLLSEPALRRAAESVRSDAPRAAANSGWIGLFNVASVDHDTASVSFPLGMEGLDQFGVIYSPTVVPNGSSRRSVAHMYGPWWRWVRD